MYTGISHSLGTDYFRIAVPLAVRNGGTRALTDALRGAGRFHPVSGGWKAGQGVG
jgi:hypothetical protein